MRAAFDKVKHGEEAVSQNSGENDITEERLHDDDGKDADDREKCTEEYSFLPHQFKRP
jgi:hypothetical protein